jgi:transposase
MAQADSGCEIGMEACAGAHHWARELQSHGYTVRLIPPQFVKPYVKSNKNDANDAEAICEAMSRPNMRFVAVKSVVQQDIQATHRIRAELMMRRKAKANQIRGLVAEYGLVAPLTLRALRSTIPCWLEDAENGLTDYFRSLLNGLWSDLVLLDETRQQQRSNQATAAATWCRPDGGHGIGRHRRYCRTIPQRSANGRCIGADTTTIQFRRKAALAGH